MTLNNSIAPGRETYHAKIQNPPANPPNGVQSIHDQIRLKKEGLERWLNYARWPKNSFRVLLFSREKSHEDYAAVRREEDAALAGGRYRVAELSPTRAAVVSEGSADWTAEKSLSFRSTPTGFDIVCDLAVRRNGAGTASVYVGIEVVANFLAPATTDRYFESGGQRFPLRWMAALPGMELRLVDEWQRVQIVLRGEPRLRWWISPIETISQSESGFERVYQGSAILAVWEISPPWWREFSATLTAEISLRG